MAVTIEKEKFSIDDRGRIRYQLRYKADSRTDALTGIPRTFEGLFLLGTSGTPWIDKNGAYLVDATYGGLIDESNPELDSYEVIEEFQDKKLSAFPDRELLEEEFGAYIDPFGDLRFPETLPKTSRLGSGLSLNTYRDGDNAEEQNPLNGATTYKVAYAVAIHRMVRKRIPARFEKMVGTVVDRIPAQFEYSGRAESWWIPPLRRRKVGNAWDIEMRYEQVDDFKDQEALVKLMQRTDKRRSGLGRSFGTFNLG
jgi:hypothetical protein